MPKTKMTKSKWALVAILMLAVGATAIHRSMASNQSQDHQHHQQASPPQQAQQNLPPLLVDGAIDPSAIPDWVAYDFLFHSVTNGPDDSDLERTRASVLAQKAGLSEAKTKVLKDTASKCREELKILKAQERALKDQHWPKPSESIMGQLTALQHQKEAALHRSFRSLLVQLDDEDIAKLNKRLLEIKKSAKVYQDIPIEKYQAGKQ